MQKVGSPSLGHSGSSGFRKRGLVNGVSPSLLPENETEKKRKKTAKRKRTEKKKERKRKKERNGKKERKQGRKQGENGKITRRKRKEKKEKTEKRGKNGEKTGEKTVPVTPFARSWG